MNRKHVSSLAVLAVAVVVGCKHDADGSLVTAAPVAGLRYINLVPDTGGMDFRVIDVVGDAPNTVNATFRTGGSPYGVTIVGMPAHTAVAAGTRHIRAFMSGSTIPIASTVMLDMTYAFDAGQNYTVYLWGYSRTGGTPAIAALVVKDSVPTLAANQFAVRALHLAPTLAPTLASTGVSVWVDTLAAATTPTGTPTFASVAPGAVTAYQAFTARAAVTGPPAVPALNYRTSVTVATTTTPFFQVDVPNGTAGTSTVNPIAGDLIAGSALTSIIVPPSVTGSQATAFATPTLVYIIDQRPPRTAP